MPPIILAIAAAQLAQAKSQGRRTPDECYDPTGLHDDGPFNAPLEGGEEES